MYLAPLKVFGRLVHASAYFIFLFNAQSQKMNAQTRERKQSKNGKRQYTLNQMKKFKPNAKKTTIRFKITFLPFV